MILSKNEVERIIDVLNFPRNIEIPDFSENGRNREDYCQTHFPEFYDALVEYYPMVKLHRERIYLFQHGMTEPPRCPVCGKYTHLNSNLKYVRYCSRRCSVDSPETKEKVAKHYEDLSEEERSAILEKRKNTNIKRRGVSNPMFLEESKTKMKKTCKKRYGAEHYMQSDEGKQNFRKTCIRKYGDGNPMKSEEVKKKFRQTSIERFGVDNPSKSPLVQDRVRSTIIKRYGADNLMKVESFKLKQQDSCEQHYGVRNPFQSKEIQEQIKQKNREKFGCDYNCQRIENRTESVPNRMFRETLDRLGIGYAREFPIGKYIYDFKVGNILFEVNPSITHNVDFNPFGENPVSDRYHQEKALFAKDNGYVMVAVWDWDNAENVIVSSIGKDLTVMDASEFEVRFASPKESAAFVYSTESDGSEIDYDSLSILERAACSDGRRCVSLVKDGTIYAMMIAQPEGYMSIDWVRTAPGVKIIGGIRKMAEFLVANSGISWVDSTNVTLDLSKAEWKEFVDNGFVVESILDPQTYLYSLKNHNVINQYEFDRKLQHVEEDVISELAKKELDQYESENPGCFDDYDEEGINIAWISAEDDVRDLETTRAEIERRINRFYKKLGEERYVKIYDCGSAKLVFFKN